MTVGDRRLTVADVLALPVLREGVPEVLAGHPQLGRTIRWVHSGEFPDMPSVLKGGELLLSHGMSIPTSHARQRRYIADLARAGIAGLMIELGSALAEIPSPVLDEARHHDLPLIALHRPIPWVEVTETIHRMIVRRQDALFERGQQLQERFFALLTAGAGVAEVLAALAEAVGNPVVLSHDGELVYYAARGLSDAAVASAWEAVARDLPTASPVLSVSVSVAADSGWGVASVLGVQRGLDGFDRVALERAVPILALAFLRAHEADTLAARDRGDFLDTLLDAEEPLEEHQAHRRAATIGFASRPSWLLPVAAGLAAGFGRLDERQWAQVGRHVRQELASRQTGAVVGTLRQRAPIALVVGIQCTEHRARTADAVADAIQRGVDRTGSRAPVVVCVGRPGASWHEVRDGLRETVAALPGMRHAPPQAWHDLSSPNLRQLLWSLRDHSALTEFAARRLAPLIEHDARRGTNLVQTLAAYCACRGRKAEAARFLHLERQSLYKRLGKIQTLIGSDLEDEDTLLGLHLALRAQQLMPRSQVASVV